MLGWAAVHYACWAGLQCTMHAAPWCACLTVHVDHQVMRNEGPTVMAVHHMPRCLPPPPVRTVSKRHITAPSGCSQFVSTASEPMRTAGACMSGAGTGTFVHGCREATVGSAHPARARGHAMAGQAGPGGAGLPVLPLGIQLRCERLAG
jgi:hypothetical protein